MPLFTTKLNFRCTAEFLEFYFQTAEHVAEEISCCPKFQSFLVRVHLTFFCWVVPSPQSDARNNMSLHELKRVKDVQKPQEKESTKQTEVWHLPFYIGSIFVRRIFNQTEQRGNIFHNKFKYNHNQVVGRSGCGSPFLPLWCVILQRHYNEDWCDDDRG